MRITVMGVGYVGLVTSVGFSHEHDVTAYDVDKNKISALIAGDLPIYEPGLKEQIAATKKGSLKFTSSIDEAAQDPEIIILAVGTPPRSDGSANLEYLEQAAHEIASRLRAPCPLVVKSTVPSGTCDELWKRLHDDYPYVDAVVSNPEFLREGSAFKDFLRPNRIIIGHGGRPEDKQAAHRLANAYQTIKAGSANLGTARILFMNRKSAELTKHASNAMLAVRISFMNELSHLCDKTGADITEIAKGMGYDHRIGPAFLNAGPGFGGSCFPKDLQALVHTANKHSQPLRIAEGALHANDWQRDRLAYNLAHAFRVDFWNRQTVTLWGVTFKPETDDIRESPALTLITQLVRNGARVIVSDPKGLKNAEEHCDAMGLLDPSLSKRLTFEQDPYKAAEGANILALMTEWKEYQQPNWSLLASVMKSPAGIFDARNIYDPQEVRLAGFYYKGIGRGAERADTPMKRAYAVNE